MQRLIFMKKAILAPLYSALVIPGLGQIINQDIKKGIIMLACVFVLVIALVVRLYKIISAMINSGAINTLHPDMIMDKIISEGSLTLGLLVAVSLMLWLYSVIDAFIGGLKADKAGDA